MGIKIGNINQRIVTSLEKFSKNGGEKISNYANAAGKAVIAPMVIMHNPFSKENKENRKWAAVKQPIEAVITVAIQTLSLSLLFAGMDKLFKSGKFNFKAIQEATLDHTKIPKKIMEACNFDKDLALKNYTEQFNNVFKDRVGAILSILTYIPVLAISNKIYPKIAEKIIGKKDEHKTN